MQYIQKPGGEPVDLLQTINPNTNKPFLNLQEAADIGGYVPVAAPPTPVVGINDSINEIDQGSDDITDQNTLLQNALANLTNDDGVDSSGIDIGAEFEKLQQQSANLGLTTESELKRIDEAGAAAGAEFDPLIANAEERAKQGQAANIVATGRRGGFQRTRYAGQAALGPTQGDVGYAGAGGKLEATESAFQRNIDALRSQKTRAIALAKAQARQAIKTGKQQDFTNAKSMLDFARQMDQDAQAAEQDMFDRLFDIKQEIRAESAEDRAQITADFNIIKDLPAGETINIRGKKFVGIAVENVEPFWTSASVVSLMKELKVGETDFVDDPVYGRITFNGLKADEPNTQVFKSVNQNTGTETFTTIDQDTGKILNQEKSIGTGAIFKVGNGSSTGDKDKDKFFTELNSAADDLRSGKSWGATYNTVFAHNKTGDPEQDAALGKIIDSSLDKDFWSQFGAYTEFKNSTKTKQVVSTSYNDDGSKTIIYSDGSSETID